MGLLAGDERASSREGFGNGYGGGLDEEDEDDAAVRNGGDEAKMKMKVPLTREDKKAIALLIVLCAFSSHFLSLAFSCRPINPHPTFFADSPPSPPPPMVALAPPAFVPAGH